MSSNNLPPPFYTHPASHSASSIEESLLPAVKDTEADVIFEVKLGGADLNGPGHDVKDLDEEGMIMGPSHPIFTRDPHNNTSITPDLRVPPGARFDPISPVGPGFYSPGDPDFDDLLPPPPSVNPLGPSIRPPRKPKSTNLGGHPFGAPPGAGNPPFFM